MKFHPLSESAKCPFCGKKKLIYFRQAHHGDLYRCHPEMGGCGRNTVHRRRKGESDCGLTPILNFARFGNWMRDACKG